MYTAPVQFGAWHPIAAASSAAPESPGVLQARAAALRAYPRGKSAMVHYACTPPDETLRAFVVGRGQPELARAERAGAAFVRFAAATDPERALARLVAAFAERFGAPPLAQAG